MNQTVKQFTGWTVAAVTIVVIIFGLLGGAQLIEEVKAGEYHIVQYPNGKVVAKKEPGWYGQWFGTVTKWPNAGTLNFDANPDVSVDSEAQNDIDIPAIEVRFADGTIAPIEGSLRFEMPASPDVCVDLVTKYGYRNVHELVENLIARRVRVSVNSAATMMTAIESSSSRRNDYIQLSWDQIQNGLYMTEIVSTVADDGLGNSAKREIKVASVKLDVDGNPIRQHEASALDNLGVILSNFEIKGFLYPKELENQIANQRDAIMAISVARANAERAEEEAKTKEAQGLSLVMEAKYQEEQAKVRATVRAEQEKEVALIAAQKEKEQATIQAEKLVDVAELEKQEAEIRAAKELEVAKLARQAAEEEAARTVALGEAEAAAKKAVFTADGALKQKLDAYVAAQTAWANAFSVRKVPNMVLGGTSGDGTTDAFDLQTAIAVKLMNDLNVDLGTSGTNFPQ